MLANIQFSEVYETIYSPTSARKLIYEINNKKSS